VSAHGWIVLALVGPAALLVVVCAVGVLVMPDPLQKLHYLSPAATVSATLIAIAAYVDGPLLQMGNKALVVAVVLTVMNGVAGHATARAAWVRALGRWSADPKDAKAVLAVAAREESWEDPA
jgi:multicomponent Na+:H+ antiporter subunit G